MRQLAIIALVLPLLTGCGIVTAERWPDHGTGGLAEWQPIDDAAIMRLQQRLDTLRARGATAFAAADYEEALQWMVRTRREYAGGLSVDVQGSYQRASKYADDVERKVMRAGHGAQAERRS